MWGNLFLDCKSLIYQSTDGGEFFFSLQEKDLVPDGFIVYGEHYKKIREAMAKLVLGASHGELTATLEVQWLENNEDIIDRLNGWFID